MTLKCIKYLIDNQKKYIAINNKFYLEIENKLDEIIDRESKLNLVEFKKQILAIISYYKIEIAYIDYSDYNKNSTLLNIIIKFNDERSLSIWLDNREKVEIYFHNMVNVKWPYYTNISDIFSKIKEITDENFNLIKRDN